MKLTLLLLLALVVNGGRLCAAAILEYSGTGTFSEFQTDTPYGAPNQPFNFRFELPSEPTPNTVGPNYFLVPTTVTLAVGSRPALVSDVDIAFYEAGGFSGFAIQFADYSLGFGAMGLFTGPLTGPTLQVGTFQLPGGTLTVTPVPEPTAASLGGAGLVGLLALYATLARAKGKTTKGSSPAAG